MYVAGGRYPSRRREPSGTDEVPVLIEFLRDHDGRHHLMNKVASRSSRSSIAL
jgi:hypothetical protein